LLQNSDASVATQPVGSGSPAETVVESVALESVTSFSEEATYVEASTETTYAEAPIADTPVETPESPVENVVTMAEEAFGGPATGDDLAEALTASGATSNGEGLSAAEQLLRSIEEAKELRESLQKLQADSTAETSIAGESLPAETEAMAEPAAEPVAIAETPVEHETIAPPEEQVVTHQAIIPAGPAVDEAAPEPVTYEPIALPEEPVAAPEPTTPQEEPIHDEEVPYVLEEREERPAAEEVVAAMETPAVAEVPAVEHTPTIAETPAAVETPAEAEAPKQTVTATQDFLFEPYHTIDYFASQGIKFTLDENPSDTLGKQLKSFTDWLKTMRRLPQKDREVVPDRVAEQAVQTSAAHSILGKDVVTETMAEVLAKQGMREKARVVYEKLSLLNPDKRAYFAAKIEQLNIL
jgi:hypothetical protein